MPHTATSENEERRKDIVNASKPATITCPGCGKKIPVGKTGTAIGGGTAAAAGGGGG